jgi:D-alanyl-D-alanine carboxypeptidase
MRLDPVTLLLIAAPVLAAVPALAQEGSDPTPTAAAEVPADTARAFRDAVDQWAQVPGHRGVTASVVLKNGAQWDGAAGVAADDEPMRVDHLTQIASITKTMTAAVILQLVDEGVVRLDDPIGRWLAPRLWISSAITVRQLLNHSNGLANYTASDALGALINEDETRVLTADDLLEFVGPPHFAPGARTEYTNTAFVLLGQIAERATGQSMVKLYHQRLWEPMALDEIFLPGVEEATGPVAAAVHGGQVYDPLAHMSLLSIGNSAFGLLSNARTIARWGHALFAGDIVSAERQREMRILTPAAGNIPGEIGVGLGVRSYGYLDRVQFGHSGGASFGSSLLLFDPESGVTVAVLMNQNQGADHFELAPRLLEIATERWARKPLE